MKDSVVGKRQDIGLPVTFFPYVRKNEDGLYTVPRQLRRYCLDDYAWAHKILGAAGGYAKALNTSRHIL